MSEPKAKAAPRASKPDSPLAAKLAVAAAKVEHVEKRGRNDQQKYDYVQAEDVALAAHKALAAAGLVCEFQTLTSDETAIKSKAGTDGLIVRVRGELIVTDPDSGEQIRREAMGSGSDYPGDKGIYKAMTGARKYALIHLLGIPLGDDPDKDRGKEPTAPAKAEKKAAVIGPGIAKRIIEKAWAIPAAKEKLRLAATHAAGRDVGDCDTKAKATKAVAALDSDQAQRLDEWVDSKAADSG